MSTTRKHLEIGVSSALVLGAMSVASPANAALPLLPNEYTIVLLDASGTMTEMANTGHSKWKEGILRATATIIAQRDGTLKIPSADWDPETATQTSPSSTTNAIRTNNCYAVWKFADLSVTKLWPNDGTAFKCAVQFDETQHAVVYNEVATYLNSLVSGGPTDMMPRTPLASGLCDALSAVREWAAMESQPSQPMYYPYRSVILESDGLENNSPESHACQGASSNVTFNPEMLNPDRSHGDFYAWAGGTDRGSWQWRVYTVAALDGLNGGLLVANKDQLTNYPIPDGWNNDMLGLRKDSSWLAFWQEAYGLGSADDARMWARQVTLNIDALYNYIPAGSSASNYTANDPTDQFKTLMRGLSVNSGGRFQKIQYNMNPDKRPGQYHELPGDVTDDHCVDMGDYNFINAKDRMNRPTSDSEVTYRSDANRDGWVNSADLALVLKNKGCGWCGSTGGGYPDPAKKVACRVNSY